MCSERLVNIWLQAWPVLLAACKPARCPLCTRVQGGCWKRAVRAQRLAFRPIEKEPHPLGMCHPASNQRQRTGGCLGSESPRLHNSLEVIGWRAKFPRGEEVRESISETGTLAEPCQRRGCGWFSMSLGRGEMGEWGDGGWGDGGR